MKKLLVILMLAISTIANANSNVPYGINSKEINYQLNLVTLECNKLNQELSRIVVDSVSDRIWWVERLPTVLSDLQDRIIYIEAYDTKRNAQVTMIFTRTIDGCKNVQNFLKNYDKNKK